MGCESGEEKTINQLYSHSLFPPPSSFCSIQWLQPQMPPKAWTRGAHPGPESEARGKVPPLGSSVSTAEFITVDATATVSRYLPGSAMWAPTRAPFAPGITRSGQGFISQPVSGNRRAPVPVYRTGLTGYRWKPVEFKSKFK